MPIKRTQAPENQKANPGVRNAGTQAPPRPARTRPRRKLLPPYKVLLHNDDVNDMFHVVKAILKITQLNADAAIQKMLEAHHSGVAVLLVTHRERGELYVQQFASFRITASLEPDA